MKRVIFSLQQAFKNRKGLKKIKTIKSLCNINVATLKSQGVEVLVLDYDGVLTVHNGLELSAHVTAWLKKAIDVFGQNIFILSNQPKPVRMAYFKENFPSVSFVVAKKKPYPEGMQAIIKRAKVAGEQIVLVDDRLLTGGLACVLAKCQCLLVTKPFHDFKHHFFYELLFTGLRIVERLLFFKF
jgi:uncharacterized protein